MGPCVFVIWFGFTWLMPRSVKELLLMWHGTKVRKLLRQTGTKFLFIYDVVLLIECIDVILFPMPPCTPCAQGFASLVF